MKKIIKQILKGGGKTTSFLLAALFAFALAETAQAAVIDLNAQTVSTSNLSSINGTATKNNTVVNGVLNVTGNQSFPADGTYTFGSGLTVNQTTEQWAVSGGRTVKIADGCVVNHSSGKDIYFTRCYESSAWRTYNGTSQLILDNGTFNCGSGELRFMPLASKNGNNKNVVGNFVMMNGSTLTLDAAANKELRLGVVEMTKNGDTSYKHNTVKVTTAITNSTITAKQIRVGYDKDKTDYISDTASSFNKVFFGPGTVLNVGQVYSYNTPAPTVVLDGVKLCWNADKGDSLIGQNDKVTYRVYTIGPNGLVIDKQAGYTRSAVSSLAAALQGTGGITKTGPGDITWNSGRLGSSTTEPMTFTGPLVISNGTWASTLEYQTSTFRADGGRLVLSGALSAANVTLAATEGGTLTLSGAAITDSSPDLTLAGGGTTDYFTRDSAVGTYTLDSLTLGPGAVLDLDADATTVDAINATSTNITATAVEKATINLNFLALPSPGQTFALFETDSADKFTVTSRFTTLSLPCETSVVDGKLVLTITAEDYTWNGTETNWGDTGAWTMGGASANWADGNNAIFDTAGREAVIPAAANASPAEVRFTADATISGEGTLTAPKVTASQDVTGTISATTSGSLEKTGAGTLTLGAARSAQTTVTEGTLALTAGDNAITVANLTLGTDATKPVTFDYGGNTLSGKWTDYLTAGIDITLTNGTFSTTQNPGWWHSTMPKSLTVAKDATMTTSDRFTWNVSGDGSDVTNYVNIAGGSLASTAAANNWIVQNSRGGTLVFNVTDGGLLQFDFEVYALTCRDSTTASDTPSLFFRFVDSTFRVGGGKSFRLGFDSGNKEPLDVTGVFAATNSTIDIGYGIYIGNSSNFVNNAVGSYTADFDGCVITAKEIRVYQDRKQNAVRFDNTRFVVNAAGTVLETAEAFETMGDGGTAIKPMTIDVGGLILDTNGKDCSLAADPQGTGAFTKTGTGALTIKRDQTATSPLVCEEGETILDAGLTMNRAVTVTNDATFTAKATAQSTLAGLTLEAGSTLNIASYTVGVTPVALTSLTLPASGTAALTKDSGAFGKGCYEILSKTGITVADVNGKLVPQLASGSSSEWLVRGNTLVLAVDMNTSGNVWTGFAGDGKMSTGGNWLSGTAPVAGDAIDFTGIASATTIEGDINAAFGAVTMGDFVITFSGDKMKATSFSDTAKIAVAANSTVTLDNNLVFSNTAAAVIVDTVGSGGRFVVTGVIEHSSAATAELWPYNTYGGGAIVANGLRANATSTDDWIFRLVRTDVGAVPWIIGSDGIGGSKRYWMFRNANHPQATIQPLDSDFAITTFIGVATDNSGNYAILNLNTTGDDGEAHTITIGDGSGNGEISNNGKVNVIGTGRVLVNYNSTSAYSFNVSGSATLALGAGASLGTGTVTFNAGTSLEVPSTGVSIAALAFSGSGTVALKVAGNSLLADGEYTLVTSATIGSTDDILTKFSLDTAVPALSGKTATIFREGNAIKLYVGARADAYNYGIWTGGADLNFASAANWKNGVVPRAGDTLDFSGMTAEKTIVCGDLSGTVFAGAVFGSNKKPVTIDGTLHLATMAVSYDSGNFSVAEGSKLIVDGDVTLSTATSQYLFIVHKNYGEVEIGGKVIVTGSTKGYACYDCSADATISVSGIDAREGADYMKLNAHKKEAPTVKWIIGSDGLGGGKGYWIDRGDGNSKKGTGAELKAAADFTIADPIGARQILTLDTGAGKTITVNGEIYMDPISGTVNTLTVKGSGAVNVCNTINRVSGAGAFNGAVIVTNTATLAINAGKQLTTGAITVNSGATLQVAQSGQVALGGNLTLENGACLGFNFTDRTTVPTLNVDGKTVTANGEVKVCVSGIRPKGGDKTLTAGGGFTGATLVPLNAPDWVKPDTLDVDAGNIVLGVEPLRTMILVK